MKIAAIVVTYNRKELLSQCLASLENQTHKLSKIIIIDNASTDGTDDWINSSGIKENALFTYIRLDSNTGGAGGFSAGLKYAQENNYDWSWIMDDDALPETTALEELCKLTLHPKNIYGSIAINHNHTAWLTSIDTPDGKIITQNLIDVPTQGSVEFLPFLGLLVSKEIIQRIGLPDENFFIAADDLEYCMRAKKHNADIIVAGKSRIHHPKADIYRLNIIIANLYCLRLAPWKRYYDTRNRLLIAKKYYGIGFFTKTIPGSFLRLLGALIYEQDKLNQLWAFFAGMVDGIFNIKGKRHTWWRISQ